MKSVTPTRIIAVLLSVAAFYWFLIVSRLFIEGHGRHEKLLHFSVWIFAYGWVHLAFGKKLPISPHLFWFLSYIFLTRLHLDLDGMLDRFLTKSPTPFFKIGERELLSSGAFTAFTTSMVCVLALTLNHNDKVSSKPAP